MTADFLEGSLPFEEEITPEIEKREAVQPSFLEGALPYEEEIPFDRTKKREKEERVAKSLKFFGLEPSPEAIRRIREPAAVALRGYAKGRLELPGELLQLGQRLAGIKEPIKLLPTTEDIGNIFDRS